MHIRRDFDETKYVSFFIKDDDELLEKYNEIREKVRNNIKNEFDSEPAYNEKYLKTKEKSYNGKNNANFHNNEVSKEGSPCICLSVIFIDSVFRTGKNYYPQVFIEKYNDVVKEKEILEYITYDLEISFDDQENSDEITNEK